MDEKVESPLNKEHRKLPVILNVRCGSCIFFKDRAYPAFKKPCHEIGVKKSSRPCTKYYASPFLFMKDSEGFKMLETLTSKFEKDLSGLVGMLNQVLLTKRYGFSFGQTVYVKMIGEDYLQNYAKATVISANHESVYVQGKKFAKGGTYLHGSVLTEDQWKRKKRNLVKHGRIRDPKAKEYYRVKVSPKKAIEYQVPTIDDFAKTMNKVEKKKASDVIRVK